MSIADNLEKLGIVLPQAPTPVAAYVPAVQTGNLVFVSGQLPLVEGKLKYTGLVGRDIALEQAYDAARLCAINALAALKSVAGDLERVERVVKLTGWVASVEQFTDQAKVMNGASELIGQIFGERGRHARAAVASPVLPLNAPVEVELIVELKG